MDNPIMGLTPVLFSPYVSLVGSPTDNTDERTLAIGQRIKALRVARGMTQPALAEKIGLSTKTVKNMEAGDRIDGWLRAENVARALGTSLDQLFGHEADPAVTPAKLAAALIPALPGFGQDAIEALLDTAWQVIEATEAGEAGEPAAQDYTRVARALGNLRAH